MKKPGPLGPLPIHYRDIGDYLTRDEKLNQLETDASPTADTWTLLVPNSDGDWIGQRSDNFSELTALGTKQGEGTTVFDTYTLGLATGRDAWTYNFSKTSLAANMEAMIEAYNKQVDLADLGQTVVKDPQTISWNRNLENDLRRRRRHTFNEPRIGPAAYRPFTQQHVYFDRAVNAMVYRLPEAFPTPDIRNPGILLTGPASHFEFCAIATNLVPNLHLLDTGQFFPRWTYKLAEDDTEPALDAETRKDGEGLQQIDNISAAVLDHYSRELGRPVAGDEVFAWVYGVLHSSEYRQTFADDLSKMLPRIPAPASAEQFDQVVQVGQQLLELHINYEDASQYPLHEESKSLLGKDDPELWRVGKMRWRSKSDRSAIVYNGHLTLAGIPAELTTTCSDLGPRWSGSSTATKSELTRHPRSLTTPTTGVLNTTLPATSSI